MLSAVNRSMPIALSFCLGCAAATVASDSVTPSARAADTVRWEYACTTSKKVEGTIRYEDAEQTFNRMGDEGWEYFEVLNSKYCFKRPKT